MTLSAVRLAMMDRFSQISGVNVPDDPLPREIDDKTIVVFPRTNESVPLSRGRTPQDIAIRSMDVMQVEYHRRVPYEHLGSTMGDVSTMIDTITAVAWSELAGGKFDGTIFSIQRVALVHFGALGWNEWTFGARLEISFTYDTNVSA